MELPWHFPEAAAAAAALLEPLLGANEAFMDRPGHASKSNWKNPLKIESRSKVIESITASVGTVRCAQKRELTFMPNLSSPPSFMLIDAARGELCSAQSAEAHDARARPQP